MAPDATDVSELERKYEATDNFVLPDLRGIAGTADVTLPDEFDLDATYYDTDDLRLLRSGVTLRRRYGGDDSGWHLKLPAGEDERTEVRMALTPEGTPPPEDLTTLLAARLRGARLVPVTRIRTHRERRRLIGQAGDVLAEVVSDDVRAEDPCDSREPMHWHEVEIEWAPGSTGVADSIERTLAKANVERSAHPSKLAHALTERLSAIEDRAARTRRYDTVSGLLGAYLREQLDTIIDADLDYRRDRPDAVHRARVASRRARSAIDAFCGACELGPEAALLSAELRWLGLELGAARDNEVQCERLAVRLASLAPNLIDGPVHDRIDTHFTTRRDPARQRALEALDSTRYFAILDTLERLVDRVEHDRRHSRPAKVVVVQLLEQMTARVDKRVRAVRKIKGHRERTEAAHRARKAVKRLRYVIEAARPLAPTLTDQTLDAFVELQDILGDLQDSVVAQQQLHQLSHEAESSKESGHTYGALRHLERDASKERLGELTSAWHRARAATRRLARA